MKVNQLLSQLGGMLKARTTRPTRGDLTRFSGRYAVDDQHITGWVRRPQNQPAKPPASILVIYRDKIIGTTTEFTSGAMEWEWRFTYATDFTITAADVLKEHFTLFAVSTSGLQFALRPDGAAQVGYIRSTRETDLEVELLVDFTKSGNAGGYLRDGWQDSEQQHTWTKGLVSLMEIPVSRPGARYRLELSLRPFLVVDKVPVQRLDVYLNSFLIISVSLRPGTREVKCDLPQDLTEGGSMLLRFEHPDAVRVCDVVPNKPDDRVLAVAFQRLALRRLL